VRALDEPAEPLSIGSVVGGATDSNRAWSDALTRLTLAIAEKRGDLQTPLNVNVVFHIPGHILKPDYEGERTGSFSRKRSLLMVQVAVPEKPPSDVDAEVRRRLLAALDKAELWARKRGVADDLGALKTFAASI
jgi:hypothetical protein